MLLAIPNVSEGRDADVIAAIRDVFAAAPGVRVLDVHSDGDHHRSVYTLAGAPGTLAPALLAGARVAVRAIDLNTPRGAHPHVGAIDVVPIVYLESAHRGAACAEALLAADLIASECHLPVFLYGALAAGRARADLRRGGRAGLGDRLDRHDLTPDFGPLHLHPRAGAVLVGARAPLVAFNVVLKAPATVEDARRIAGRIREGGADGRPGLRAIAVALASPDSTAHGAVQVSMNVEDPARLPLAHIVEEVRRHAPVASAELVGLAPRAALVDFPADLPLTGFDPTRHVLENALGL